MHRVSPQVPVSSLVTSKVCMIHRRQWFQNGYRILLAVLVAPSFTVAADVLPRAATPFTGKIERSIEQSQHAWPQAVRAAKDAPNVIVILLDDVGFGAASTFGGVAETETLQGLANEGLRYNHFHVAALCAPTRAAALTGRNPHQVGFGTVATSGYPGYNSVWNKDTVSVAEVLRQNGYSTAAFGKWHNTPAWEITPAGPYDRWPTSLGFEYFFGFFGGADNQWEPRAYRNTTPVEPTRTPQQGYHLIAEMADDATRWLRTHDAVYPDKPFFIWFAPGGTHWPHHVPADWIARYRGKFDQGWDKIREETFARQKALGVIPADTVLTPRPPELPAWDSLSADERKLLVRQAEITAAFLDYTDHQVGRLLASVQELGRSDNTLVLYIVGDNGGEIRGNLLGRDAWNADGSPRSLEDRLKLIDRLGGPELDNLNASGWGWAENTPFKYGKGIPAYLGNVRNPLVVSWPAKIRERGGLRTQFSHVTDIAPTLLEVAGIEFPRVFEGIEQVPLEGKSLVPTFFRADVAIGHDLQYFENGGTRAIYHDGWWAGSRRVNAQTGTIWNQPPLGTRDWELYDLSKDFSQANDLAAVHPERVKQLEALFDQEAVRNDVYPLAPTGAGRPNAASGRTVFDYRAGVTRIPSGNGPNVTQRAHRIEADIVLPAKGGDGVIIADGGRWGGFSLYIKNGRLVYAANAHGHRTGHIVSTERLKPGAQKVVFEFTPDASARPTAEAAFGQPPAAVPGRGRLSVGGRTVGEGGISKIAYGPYETLDIGADLGTPVSADYTVPFAFAGNIDKVRVELR